MVATVQAKNGNGVKLDARQLSEVIDRMRDVQTEGDRWDLAEALKAMLPQGGAKEFNAIIDKATQEGVVGNLGAHTLRLYRDTAQRWPANKRVKNISFSAHREAMVLPSIDDAVTMLNAVSKAQGGPNKVTVASVRKAVAIKQGKKPTAKAAGAGGTSPTRQLDVLRDLEQSNGAELIRAIGNETDSDKLDKLNAGLLKVIAHVEKLRSKAAQAKAKAKAPVKATPPKANGAAKKPAAKKAAGDMRGL